MGRSPSHLQAVARIKDVRARAIVHPVPARWLPWERRDPAREPLDEGWSRSDSARELSVSRQAIGKVLS